jgi:hypothetical protein
MQHTQIDWPRLIQELSQPFPASVISWRAGSVTRDKKRAQALPYAEPRVYEDRLNTVCPDLWSVSFRPWGDSRIICDLTIGGLTRSSTGEENEGFAPGTAAEAQAFKRACVKFGLGRYLYDLPVVWVDYDAEKGKLLEVPELPTQYNPREAKPKAEAPREAAIKGPAQPAQANTPPASVQETPQRNTLSTDRAKAMYRELEKLGVSRAESHKLSAGVLGRDVTRLTELTEPEAVEVWQVAKRQSMKRAA